VWRPTLSLGGVWRVETDPITGRGMACGDRRYHWAGYGVERPTLSLGGIKRVEVGSVVQRVAKTIPEDTGRLACERTYPRKSVRVFSAEPAH
jgi:hypothetical protein